MVENMFNKLLEFNKKFFTTNSSYKALKDSQHPNYIIIACSDSRVTPTIVMDQDLGKFFEIRVAGCVIDESAIASIEYAVSHLNTQNILFMAHTKCGAVTEAQKLFKKLIYNKKPELNTALDRLAYSIYKNISNNSENVHNLDNAIIDNTKFQKEILLNSKIIRKKFQTGELKIGIGMYNLDTGELSIQ